MKKLFLCSFVLFFSLVFKAQELPKITPPSPEASSLAKFELMPVSHFTGVPNISVPLYTIKQDGITIPISLSYHARGMKVGEISSRVGIGWALNYGGSLSRQARGFEDEANYGYLANRNKIKNSLSGSYGLDELGGGVTRRGFLSNTINIAHDITPDKFIFNANGASGDFFIDYQDLGLVAQSYGDIKIEEYPQSNSGNLEGFKVTDSRGNVFYYGRKQYSNNLYHNKDKVMESGVYSQNTGGYNSFPAPIEGPFPNSWMLMEIQTVNGTSISFSYVKETTRFHRRTKDVFDNTLETYISKIDSEQWQIDEITFDKGKIKFISDTANPREDVIISSGTHTGPLGKIQIYDKKDTLVKQYKMTYEYKQAIADGNYHFYTYLLDSRAQKRLFLKTITEQDAQGASKPSQTFHYNSQQIPNRFSNSQDIWGYYNGASNGNYLTFSDYSSTSNNRTVDTIKSQAGLLEKITHPTGGTTEFTYEQNKGKLPLSTKNVVFGSINPFFAESVFLTHLNHAIPPPPNNNGFGYFNSSTQTYENHFEIKHIHHSGSGGIDATVDIQVPTQGCDQNNPNQSLCNFLITLERGAYTQYLFEGSNFIPRSLLPPGQYVLKVKPQNHIHDPYNQNHAFSVGLQWSEQKELESDIVYAGGKRIKRIENKDENSNTVNFKEYEYKDENGITSGRIVGLPNYLSINKEQNFNGFVIYDFTDAAPGIPVSSMQGNSIGYEYVTEYFGDKNNNIGKVFHKFTTFEDTGDFLSYPQHIPTDNSWLRGVNLFTKVYGIDQNSNYILLKETINDYLYADILSGGNTFSVPFYFFNYYHNMENYLSHIDYNIYDEKKYFKDRKKFNIPFLVFEYNWGWGADPNYKVFSLTGGTQHLLRTIEKNYTDSGVLENTTMYGYNYDNHYQLSETKTTNSKGEQFIGITKYPQDFPSSQSLAINGLVSKHQFIPIEQTTYKDLNNNDIGDNNEKITHTYTKYKDWGFNKILPEKIQASKGTSSLEDRIIYHDYDDKSNPLEVSKKDGSRIYYVWGYDKTQPIAKIEGYTCQIVNDPIKGDAEVCFTTDQWGAINAAQNASLQENTAATEANLRLKLQELRDEFTNTSIQVTTFTYDPLIGVTSVTDLRGQTIYYHYDNFNRLQFVKDKDGNILSKTEYNYKN